jgi:hypothetical protein
MQSQIREAIEENKGGGISNIKDKNLSPIHTENDKKRVASILNG